MVIRNLHIVGISLQPLKADAPFIVYPYAVLSLTVSPKFFQPIRRRDTKILQSYSVLQHPQLAQSDRLNRRRQPPRSFPPEDPLCLRRPKAPYHEGMI